MEILAIFLLAFLIVVCVAVCLALGVVAACLKPVGRLALRLLRVAGKFAGMGWRLPRGVLRRKRANRFREAAVDSRMLTSVPRGTGNNLGIISAAREILSKSLGLELKLLAATVMEHKFVAITGRGELGFALVAVRYNAHHERVPSKAAATRRFIMQYHMLPHAEHGRVRIIAGMHPLDIRPSAEMFESVARLELLGDDLLPIHAERDLGIYLSAPVMERVVLSTSPAFREHGEFEGRAHRRSE